MPVITPGGRGRRTLKATKPLDVLWSENRIMLLLLHYRFKMGVRFHVLAVPERECLYQSFHPVHCKPAALPSPFFL